MNTKTNANKLIALVGTCLLLLSFSTAQAKAVSYVDRALQGSVNAMVFSKMESFFMWVV
jgi:hypothetical protein